MATDHEPSAEPPQPTCPWCPYTGILTQVLMHMESAHHRRWCDLALSPPIASSRVLDGLFEALSMVDDKDARTSLRELALQLDTYAEGPATPI
jgi:hypothetical protein